MNEPATVIVLDAGPAISMDRLGCTETLLSQPDLDLLLPEPVAAELARKPGLPGSGLPLRLRREAVKEEALIRLRQVRGSGPMLGAGELGVIAVSERLRSAGGPHVISLLDDRNAWEFAAERWGSDEGLTGTLGLLYLVHERGLAERAVEDDLVLLREAGHRISGVDAQLFATGVRSMASRTRPGERPLPAGEAWLARMRSSGLRRSSRQGRQSPQPPRSRER